MASVNATPPSLNPVQDGYLQAPLITETIITPETPKKTLSEPAVADSTAAGSYEVITEQVAAQFGVDWRLVYAIGEHESGYQHCPSGCSISHNFWGRKAIGGGWRSWPDFTSAVTDEVQYIKTNYIDIGLTTPALMQPKYCPDGSPWAVAVQTYMDNL